MPRAALALIIAILYLVLTLPVMGILRLIGRKHPETMERATKAMISWIFRVLLAACGTKVTFLGEENVPKDTPVLYIGNHRSMFDVVITYMRAPGVTAYVAKKELEKVPIFGWWAQNMHALFFNRDDMKEAMKMIKDGIDLLKGGTSVFVFPEGTRNKNPEELPLLEFHEGSFRMASRSGCPIIPVSICNTSNVWEGHFPWIHSAKVIVEYGAPIYMKELSREQQKHVGAYVREQMQETIQKNREKYY